MPVNSAPRLSSTGGRDFGPRWAEPSQRSAAPPGPGQNWWFTRPAPWVPWDNSGIWTGGEMLPLYARRIEDLGPDDFVKVDCAVCHHIALLPAEALLRAGGNRQHWPVQIVGIEPDRCRKKTTAKTGAAPRARGAEGAEKGSTPDESSFQEIRTGLCAGGRWIRTLNPSLRSRRSRRAK